MESKTSILDKLRGAKEELRERFAISRLALFGSYAKGTFHESSDIDILYFPEENSTQSLADYLDLQDYFSTLFDVERVDLVNKRYLNPVIEYFIKDSLIYV